MNEIPSRTEHEINHQRMTLWAADCAAHILDHFESHHPQDPRPREAIEAARGWVRETTSAQQARDASFGSYAAAREACHPAAHYAARAAGHAAESAHAMEHARHAAAYAVTAAAEAAGGESAEAAIRERNWQYRRLQAILQPAGLLPESAGTKKKGPSRASARRKPASKARGAQPTATARKGRKGQKRPKGQKK